MFGYWNNNFKRGRSNAWNAIINLFCWKSGGVQIIGWSELLELLRYVCVPLCYRRGYERLNVDTELRSGDLVSLVLKNPQEYLGCLGTEYGGKTYNPVVFQTDLGISKFFSILKFIVSSCNI